MGVEEGGQRDSPGRDRRVLAATIALGAAVLAVPAVFALMLSAGRVTPDSSAVADGAAVEAKTDRTARVTFRLRPGVLGLRILRNAPRETIRALRGRKVRVLCGSVAGLEVVRVRWPRDADTLEVELAASPARTEFCAIKRGAGAVARAVFG